MSQTKRPTIFDVAAAAGVSKSLVSMVLRGDEGPSAASRAAVLAAANTLGYRPNRAASILAAGRTNTIGVVLDDYRNLWYLPLFNGIRDALAPYGVRVATADKTSNAHLAVSPLDDLMSLRVDGVVIAAELAPDLPAPEGVPVVIAGNRMNSLPGADIVAGDDDFGAALAVRHLIDLGHRVIGHLAGSDGAGVQRSGSYRRTMLEAGLEPMIIGGDSDESADGGAPDTTEADGYRLAVELLRRHPETTAIFAANDTMAMGAMGAAREAGRRVPDDLSVVGYDDSPIASTALLRLTTVDARSEDIGRIAAQTLLRRLAGDTGELDSEPSLTTLEPRLVVRGSTAPIGDHQS